MSEASKKVPPISRQETQLLEQAVEQVVEQMSDHGLDVHTAMAKVAEELNVPRGHIPVLTRCFNISCSNQTRKQGRDVFERSQNHELADPEKVYQLMAGPREPKKEAQEPDIDPAYLVPPEPVRPLRKSALAESPGHEPDPVQQLHRQYQEAERLEAQARTAEVTLSASLARLEDGFSKLANWLYEHPDVPLPALSRTCELGIGEAAPKVFGQIYEHYPVLKKRAALEIGLDTMMPLRPQAEPFLSVRNCLRLADSALQSQEKLALARQAVKTARERISRPLLQRTGPDNLGIGHCRREPAAPEQPTPTADDERHKAAGLFWGTLAGAGGTAFGRSMAAGAPGAKTKEQLEEKAYQKLIDPEHESRLRAIHAETMLNDLLANDEVIRGYDPQEVAGHFNELVQLAPRAATQQGAMRSLIRRRLNGPLDQFELDSLLKLETNLRRRDTPGNTFGTGQEL